MGIRRSVLAAVGRLRRSAGGDDRVRPRTVPRADGFRVREAVSARAARAVHRRVRLAGRSGRRRLLHLRSQAGDAIPGRGTRPGPPPVRAFPSRLRTHRQGLPEGAHLPSGAADRGLRGPRLPRRRQPAAQHLLRALRGKVVLPRPARRTNAPTRHVHGRVLGSPAQEGRLRGGARQEGDLARPRTSAAHCVSPPRSVGGRSCTSPRRRTPRRTKRAKRAKRAKTASPPARHALAFSS